MMSIRPFHLLGQDQMDEQESVDIYSNYQQAVAQVSTQELSRQKPEQIHSVTTLSLDRRRDSFIEK